MFRRSLRHPQEEFLSLLKTICYCKAVKMVELHSKKYVICGMSTWFRRGFLIFKKN